tara:strand:+ start:2961 stop:3407 length:447 start_codon:yes stop_codon:yes gene_type:complete
MALRDGISGREFDKFVNTSDGTALRVATVAGGSVASNLVTASGSADILSVETILINKQTLSGKTGSWFVYNAGLTDISVEMHCAYASGAADFVAAGTNVEWNKVGSTQVVATTETKHIPFNNVYRFVALTAYTGGADSDGVTAELYAL